MVNDIVTSAAIRETLLSVNRSQRLVDDITLRLSTGLKVNTSLDNPQNFFAAGALQNRASDFARLLDGIGISRRTIEEGLIGLEAIEGYIDQAEAIATRSREILASGGTDPQVFEQEINSSPQTLSSQIAADLPDVYFRLNETGGPIVDSGVGAAGPVAANYTNGAAANAAPLYTNGAAPSVQFDGVNDRISVADSTMINLNTTPARTVELVFNADTVAGRQVLYEEGATVNGLTIYIDNGDIYVTAEDDNGANRYADININAPIVAGQTYHVAFVFEGSGGSNSFTGYLDGVNIGSVGLAGDATFPSHSGDIGIGGVNGGVQFHDGENGTGSGFNFQGRISDVAIYNRGLTAAELLSHAESLDSTTTIEYLHSDFENVLNELDNLVIDANYRGINLLADEDLVTNFNPDGSNFLITEGIDLSALGTGILRNDFNDLDQLDLILESVREARDIVRRYGTSLVNDLSIINSRRNFTEELINNHTAGSRDLVIADQNEEGANLLAAQTRQALGTTALSLAAETERNILTIFEA